MVSILTGKSALPYSVQELYCFRDKGRGLDSIYRVSLDKAGGKVAPKTYILASKEVKVTPLLHLGTRDVTAVILEFETIGHRVLVSNI